MMERLPLRPLWYLASPYSKYPGGTQKAFELASKKAAQLMLDGFAVFCPIAHSHPIELYGLPEPQNHEFWLGQDLAVLDLCDGLFVYKLEGWDTSFGVGEEIKYMQKRKRKIVYV